MNKKYIITFSISVIILFSFGIIMIMLMTPQETQIVETSVTDYSSIGKSDYTYTQTKDITQESLVKEYTISSDDVSSFEQKNVYNPGNSDPFTPSADVNTSASTDNSQQNTTNSNGGTSNPPATSK